MRKYSLYAVCASMMLASCSLSEEENLIHSPESEGIKFSTYVGMNTPTRAMDKTTFSNSNVIGLNACKTAGSLSGNFTNNFMTNEALTKTGFTMLRSFGRQIRPTGFHSLLLIPIYNRPYQTDNVLSVSMSMMNRATNRTSCGVP